MPNFDNIISDLARAGTVQDAQAAIRASHGRQATAYVAGEAGIARRTARRWLSSNPPASRSNDIRRLAGTGGIAAQRLRTSRVISLGRVRVTYDGRDEGSRNIPDLDLSEIRGLSAAYDALAAGDTEVAQYLFSSSILEAYGPGLGETLEISDFSRVRLG